MTEGKQNVLNAWAAGTFAASGSFRARDGNLSSYGILIGKTVWEGERKVLRMVELGMTPLSKTNKVHINAGERFQTVWNRSQK